VNEELAARYLDGDVLAPDELAELGDDLGELAELQRLLADPALWDEPPADLEDRVVRAVRSELSPVVVPDGGAEVIPIDVARRRTVRTSLLSAAAAAVVAAGIAVGLSRGSNSEVEGAELALPDNRVGALQVKDTQSGLRIHLNAPDLPRLPDGQFYQAWLRSNADAKHLVAIGTFHTGVDVTLWAGVPIEQFSTLTVTIEPDDGDPASSGNRVLAVDLTPVIGKT
jgi:hypothetical protein